MHNSRLRAEGQKEPRTVLYIDLPVGADKERLVRIATTHLDHSTPAVRTTMLNTLRGAIMNADIPVLLSGDFNARPNEVTLTTVMSDWERFFDDSPTFPSGMPTAKIDYLMGYPKGSFKVINSKVLIDTDKITDHCGLYAELEIE